MRPRHARQPATLLLDAAGWIPNSPARPALIWSGAVQADDLATAFETRFAGNGWTNSWRDGIYEYHHFHSTAHEVLGLARGRVHLQLGGPHGPVRSLGPGDVVVVPAGVGHRNVGSSADLLVVGAYAGGRDFDLCREDSDRAKVRANLKSLPDPATDPLDGAEGALVALWTKAARRR
ncbi:MAG: cupin [Rhodospirillales bacterium]|nr:cupin [Rhodospirillales bacterium]